MKVYRSEDFKHMSWKNGKGTTNELIRIPHPKNPEFFELRLSIAHMTESGPFSHYPGIERTIILLEGKGVVLDFVDEIKMHMNVIHKPIQFAGEAEIEGTLIDGAIRDFNIMAARDSIEAYVEVFEKVPLVQIGGDLEHYCYIVEGTADSEGKKFLSGELIHLAKGEKLSLKSKDLLTVIDTKIKRAQ